MRRPGGFKTKIGWWNRSHRKGARASTKMISLDKTVCSDLQSALAGEWLETNGIGGFKGPNAFSAQSAPAIVSAAVPLSS